MSEHTVTRNDERNRYELRVGDELAALVDFIEGDGGIVFTHTETLPNFSGQGLGLEVVQHAVADAVEREHTITPLCPFVRRYLERNEVPGANINFPESP
ncbi:GNAT family N-acetyltransferase [Demequina sp.]|uniref:GNAT family N-acetyltransferase n=1 Tax=Demequina sp. TaxID=2050685 RepID=UPI003D12A06A